MIAETTLVKLSKYDKKNTNKLHLFFTFKSAGAVIGTFIGGRLVKDSTFDLLFGVMILLSIFMILISLLYFEHLFCFLESESKKEEKDEQSPSVWDLLKNRSILSMVFFIF